MLAVADQRQPRHTAPRGERVAQRDQVEPQVVGVEVRVAVLVGEPAHVVLGRLRRVTQDHPPVGLPPAEMAALAVRRGPPAHLRGVRCPARREPAGDPPVGGGTEIVRVGGVGVPVAAGDQLVEQPGAEQSDVDVTVAGRAPLQRGVRRPVRRLE
ncbi:hypothetical protein SDC9_115565 [bioreactor metagenome]|uniref:Uncharacterized protein n=1 Tax=bioreactor metagenome TaxID=1076179 RepID=A0A645BVK5_9ZZZZ